MKNTNHTYGITINGVHTDTSNTERGAKMYARKNGYTQISIRYNCGYIAQILSWFNGKLWVPIDIFYRLEYLRGELIKECISYDELIELRAIRKYIHKDDVQLREASGMRERY